MNSAPASISMPHLSRLWFAPVAALLAMLAVLLILHDTALDIVSVWNQSGTYTHGYTVLPISMWLMWRERDRIFAAGFRPAWLALPALALCVLLWLIGDASGAAVVTHAALVGMLMCCVWAAFGTAAAREAWFPILFMVFMIPAGDFLLPVLMEHTADFTVAALRLTGIPVYREGLSFVIPSGMWSVVEACSGLRYLVASIMVGALFAYLNYRSVWRRVLFLLAAVLVPLVANWVRAYMIVMIGHLSGNTLAVGVDHLIYGWLFFGVVIFALFWVGSFWREDHGQSAPRRIDAASIDVARGGIIVVTVVAVLIAATTLPLRASLEPSATARYALDGVAPAAGWTQEGMLATHWLPDYKGKRAEFARSYRKGAQVVTLYVAFYAEQGQDSELVQWANQLFPEHAKDQWKRLASDADTLPFPQGTQTVQHLALGGIESAQVWYWLWLDGRITTSESRAKLDLAFKRLARKPDDSAAVFLTVPAGAQARGVAEEFMRDHGAALESMLRDARR